MFNWFFWRKDFIKNNNNPEYLQTAISCGLEDKIAETRELSARIIQKLEDKLDDREALLNEVFNTINGFLCLKDGIGNWKLLNNYGKKLYGLEGISYKEKSNKEVSEIASRYNLDFASSDELAWVQEDSIEVEERVILGNTEHIFQVTKTPVFDTDGSRKYMLIHGVDVTEEYENNRQISMLIKALNHASDAIVVADYNHRIIYANDAYCKCTGYTVKELMGMYTSFVSLINPNIEIDVTKVIETGQVWQGKVSNKHKNGTLVDGMLTITPMLNGKPYPVYYVCVKRLL